MIKEQIIELCRAYLQEKQTSLQLIITDINEATHTETKSTAGDKHETGRAMMQLEQEKLNKQLADIQQQITEFNKIDFSKISNRIALGSLIETDKGYYLIASAIGKLTIELKNIFVISPQSPLGIAFKGYSKDETVSFNNTSYKILSVV